MLNVLSVVCCVLLMLPLPAYAFNILDVDYTGNVAERLDSCGYACGIGSNPTYLGGSLSTNSLGSAFQFNVYAPMDIDYLLASAHVRAESPIGPAETMPFSFKLYSNTLTSPAGQYPDVGSFNLGAPILVSTSTQPVYIPEIDTYVSFNQDGYYTDVPLSFDVTLQPGTYWLAQERDLGVAGPIVDNISTKFAANEGGANHAVPEPATFIILALGLVALFVTRRLKLG